MNEQNRLPAGLAVVPVDLIEPCPIQPRVNVSVDLVEKLSDSIRSGRHQPLLEVEPAPGHRGRYQIVFGEQRWRAAKAAGLLEILVRVHPHLGYLERLEKQYEENHLRADLDVVEEAHCIVVDKTIRDIAIAEQLLRDSLVPFKPLDESGSSIVRNSSSTSMACASCWSSTRRTPSRALMAIRLRGRSRPGEKVSKRLAFRSHSARPSSVYSALDRSCSMSCANCRPSTQSRFLAFEMRITRPSWFNELAN